MVNGMGREILFQGRILHLALRGAPIVNDLFQEKVGPAIETMKREEKTMVP
jgi:hypothetical protein